VRDAGDVAVDAAEAVPLRWGFAPVWNREGRPTPINARGETVRRSSMFRDAFINRRCLVPMSGFYEWQATPGVKQPWHIFRVDGQPLLVAAIWTPAEPERAPRGLVSGSFALLTTAASEAIAGLHHRMPVVLEPHEARAWCVCSPDDAAALLRPAADGVLGWHAVSRRVNSTRNDDPSLVEPAPDAGETADETADQDQPGLFSGL